MIPLLMYLFLSTLGQDGPAPPLLLPVGEELHGAIDDTDPVVETTLCHQSILRQRVVSFYEPFA